MRAKRGPAAGDGGDRAFRTGFHMKSRLEKINWEKAQPIAFWILGSLLTIAIIGRQPYLGLGAAILSGVTVGLASVFSSDEGGGQDGRL